MSELAIRVENLGKEYRIGAWHKGGRLGRAARYTRFGDALGNLVKAPIQRLRSAPSESTNASTFWALKDVSFEVEKGDVIGVIGRNGAGKSTLLKVLSRITTPTTGRIELSGRVGSLLEVGTGFHPELTGRENTYLNGAILGMSHQEIRAKFDEIVAFSEIERFIDTPVKRYSSGMYMRLAFSVAAYLEPETLLVDEVLAVGDSEFQKKCLGKMSDVAKDGRTVLFVSHNMSAIVRLCKRALVFDQGQIITDGEVSDAIAHYLSTANLNGEFVRDPDLKPNSPLTIERVALVKDNQVLTHFTTSQTLTVEIRCKVVARTPEAQVSCEIYTASGECLFVTTNQDATERKEDLMPGTYTFRCPIQLSMFRPGQYNIKVSAVIPQLHRLDEVGLPLLFEVFDDSSPVLKLGQPRQGQILPIIEWELDADPA